jgi:hypothetical protein
MHVRQCRFIRFLLEDKTRPSNRRNPVEFVLRYGPTNVVEWFEDVLLLPYLLRWLILEGGPPKLISTATSKYLFRVKIFNAGIDLALLWDNWHIMSLESCQIADHTLERFQHLCFPKLLCCC